MLKPINLFFNLSYITNFKPVLTDKFEKEKIEVTTNLRKNSHILCRNLFLYFLYLKYCNKNKNFKKISIFIKPYYSNTYTILRAPYRYKLGRHQLGLSRYYILVSLSLNLNHVFKTNNVNQIIIFLNNSKKFYPWLESNICYQHRALISFDYYLNENFKISNYK